MKKPEVDPKVSEALRRIQRMWMTWGIVPLAVSAMLMVAVSAVWASPSSVDEHIIQRGFQAVLAICAGLFLVGFWLDGKWTASERIAFRIYQAAGGAQFTPSRSQLAAQADLAFRSVLTSATTLVAIGGAIAVAAVLSVWAGLGMAEGAQIVLLGLCYQVFLFSRHAYYEELLSAASRGELVVPEEDDNNHGK